MIILFSVFFTLSYVMVLMVKDAEKSLQLLQFFISTITYESVKKTGKVMVNGMQSPAFLSF